jgi:hypothetical protein
MKIIVWTLRGTGFVLLAAAALAGACDANHVLGVNGGQAGASPIASKETTTGAAGASSQAPCPTGPTEAWTGYIEGHTFPSQSNALTLTFALDGACQRQGGSLVLGAAPPPAPATDPNVGYPLGVAPASMRSTIVEGFPYSLYDVRSEAPGNLRFELAFTDLWAGWCALQAPIPGATSCEPSWTTRVDDAGCALLDPTTNQWQALDCGKMYLCARAAVCACDGNGCVVGLRNPDGLLLQSLETKAILTFTGDKANGDLFGVLQGPVHFTKTP